MNTSNNFCLRLFFLFFSFSLTFQTPFIQLTGLSVTQINVVEISYLLIPSPNQAALVMMGVNVGGVNYIIQDGLEGDINVELSAPGNYSFFWDHALAGKYQLQLFASEGTTGATIADVRMVSVYFEESKWTWTRIDCNTLAPYFLNPKASDCSNKWACILDASRGVMTFKEENPCEAPAGTETICPAQQFSAN